MRLRTIVVDDEVIALIEQAHENAHGSPYQDAIAAFYWLTQASSGAPHRALSVALLTLVPHLPRYHRSMTAYAREISERDN